MLNLFNKMAKMDQKINENKKFGSAKFSPCMQNCSWKPFKNKSTKLA